MIFVFFPVNKTQISEFCGEKINQKNVYRCSSGLGALRKEPSRNKVEVFCFFCFFGSKILLLQFLSCPSLFFTIKAMQIFLYSGGSNFVGINLVMIFESLSLASTNCIVHLLVENFNCNLVNG